MTLIITNPRERNRFLRFAVVGVVGAIVDFGTFNLLTEVLNIQAVISSMLSFGAAVVNNFIWNRYWTYPDSRSKTISTQLFQFALISVFGLVIRTPLFALLDRPLRVFFTRLGPIEFGSLDADFLGHNLALAVAVIVVMFWNFFVNRYWTYSDVE